MDDQEDFLDLIDDIDNADLLVLLRRLVLVSKYVFVVIKHPITVANTLVQLGYEPFLTTSGRRFIFFGKTFHYNPNLYKYIIKLAWRDGINVLATGLDSMICVLIVHLYSEDLLSNYFHQHYLSVGGAVELEGKENLTDHESFRLMLRKCIRFSLMKTLCILLERPFYVTFVRQVGQIVGKEAKYTTVFESIIKTAESEGITSLYTGLPADIIHQIFKIWIVAGMTYVFKRGIIAPLRERFGFAPVGKEVITNTVALLSAYVLQPFAVCSCLMAVSGTGLAVCPISNGFSSWIDAYDYLKSVGGLRRSVRWIWRCVDER